MAPDQTTALTRHRDGPEQVALGTAGVLPQGGTATKSRPSDFEMISAIVRETDCTDDAATGVLEMLRRAVAETGGSGLWTMPEQDEDRHHEVFAQIMPDEATSQPGSAHAIVEQGLGAKLRHTFHERHCAVDTAILVS